MPEQNPGSPRWARVVNLVSLLVGAAALAWMLYQIGPRPILNGLIAVGWGFALSTSAHLASMFADAATLRACAGEAGDRVPYLTFLHAALSGHAINEATPMSKLGEVTKSSLLSAHMRPERAAAAVIVTNFIMFIPSCALMVAAAPVAMLALDVRGTLAIVLVVAAAVFLGVGIGALLLLRHGFGQAPFRVARKLGVAERRVERWQAKWAKVEVRWHEAAASPRHMRTAWICSILSRTASMTELAIILAFLGVDRPIPLAVLSMASWQVVYWFASFVPLQVGVAEGGAYVVYRAAGASASMGVVVELIRKVRRLVFIGLGMTLLGWRAARDRRS